MPIIKLLDKIVYFTRSCGPYHYKVAGKSPEMLGWEIILLMYIPYLTQKCLFLFLQ